MEAVLTAPVDHFLFEIRMEFELIYPCLKFFPQKCSFEAEKLSFDNTRGILFAQNPE